MASSFSELSNFKTYSQINANQRSGCEECEKASESYVCERNLSYAMTAKSIHSLSLRRFVITLKGKYFIIVKACYLRKINT